MSLRCERSPVRRVLCGALACTLVLLTGCHSPSASRWTCSPNRSPLPCAAAPAAPAMVAVADVPSVDDAAAGHTPATAPSGPDVLPLEPSSLGARTTPSLPGNPAAVDPAEPLTFSGRPLSAGDSVDGHSDTNPPLSGPSFAQASCDPVVSRPISVREDLHRLFPDLWDDTKSIVNVGNGLMIGGGLAVALGLRPDVDGDVREFVAENPTRWGDATRTLRVFGEPGAQVPAMFAVYGYSVWTQDEDLHDFSRAMLHAHGLTSLTVVAVKGIANTRRPTDEFLDGKWGFPSFHTAGVFAIGATVEEYYGWQPAIPIYVLGGLVGWSRIDQQEHDLSDVVFGSVLGYVIGHAVAARHLQRDNGWEIRPWYDPVQKASGMRLEVPF